jgi:TIR domain-containing protein
MVDLLRVPVKVFCSYSHRDRHLKERLEEHLAVLEHNGDITEYWSDHKLSAGTEFDPVIRRQLEEAHVILVLLSPSYEKSDYCRLTELPLAIEQYDAGRARVIPILLRATTLDGSPLSKYTIIPRDLRPIASRRDRDKAFVEDYP